ncbi:C45 family peptidase [Paenibacillus sp. FSL L8-0463]|uniref:C45 family peptidase n=1 Tax=Paenibacillus sp. FSL L8-0463 TaxID=2954687 RepID=UPI00311A1900
MNTRKFNCSLSTTRVTGKPAHIGFSLQLFGRYDGMNDEGLSVTMTSGRIRPEMTGEGFVFPGVVRALLDDCTTTREAVTLLRSMPISDYRNFLVSDRHGSMALIEVAGAHKEIKVYDARAASLPQLIVSTNHYTLPAMQQHNLQLMHNSQARQEAMYSTLWKAGTDYNPQEAMKQLAERQPAGLLFRSGCRSIHTFFSAHCMALFRMECTKAVLPSV